MEIIVIFHYNKILHKRLPELNFIIYNIFYYLAGQVRLLNLWREFLIIVYWKSIKYIRKSADQLPSNYNLIYTRLWFVVPLLWLDWRGGGNIEKHNTIRQRLLQLVIIQTKPKSSQYNHLHLTFFGWRAKSGVCEYEYLDQLQL